MKTKGGYDFYDVASLLQKSLRRGDLEYAARAANELFPQYTNYVWNRLLTVSAEDCHGIITGEIVALLDAWKQVNDGKAPKSKGRVFISKAIVLLCYVKHSRDADVVSNLISDKFPEDQFAAALVQVDKMIDVPSEHMTIPMYTYDKHTRRGKLLGKTLQDFWDDEDRDLADKVSVFANSDRMIALATDPSYVPPVFGEQGELF